MGLFTDRCFSSRKEDMWGHYHPAMKERDQSECLLFDYGKTDGLEREFRALNYPGWYIVPKDQEEK